ncbi:MAG: acyl-homoserine-lactone synthase [Shimia sp.]
MEQITFNLSTAHQFGSAFYDFLRLRKDYFVDALGWDVPHDDQVEMDQYDTPQAWYSLVLKEGRVVGGARVMPTTADWSGNTYMLGDAYLGKIPGIPRAAMPRMIADPDVWEGTRLVISSEVTDLAERSQAFEMIVNGTVEVAQHYGCREMITLTRLSLLRTFRSIGFAAERLGEVYRSEEDGAKYAVLTMPAIASTRSQAIAAE